MGANCMYLLLQCHNPSLLCVQVFNSSVFPTPVAHFPLSGKKLRNPSLQLLVVVVCLLISVRKKLAFIPQHMHGCMGNNQTCFAGSFVGTSNVSTTVYNGMGFNHTWEIDADAGTVLQCSKVLHADIASMLALVHGAKDKVGKGGV